MKKFRIVSVFALSFLIICSCNTKLEDEADYSFPLEITTKGDNPVSLEIIDPYLIKDLKEEPGCEAMDFFACDGSFVPGKRGRFMADELVTLWVYIPDLELLEEGQEIPIYRLMFVYLWTASGDNTSKITSGRMVYRGMKGDKAMIEFQDVLFITGRTRYATTGEHLFRGTLECTIYENFEPLINPNTSD